MNWSFFIVCSLQRYPSQANILKTNERGINTSNFKSSLLSFLGKAAVTKPKSRKIFLKPKFYGYHFNNFLSDWQKLLKDNDYGTVIQTTAKAITLTTVT